MRGQLNNSALHSLQLLSNPVSDTCRLECGKKKEQQSAYLSHKLITCIFLRHSKALTKRGLASFPQVPDVTIDFLTCLSPL